MRPFGFQVGDDCLQIAQAACQPVDAGHHQRLARMNEVEDGFELGPTFKAGTALLLRPDHAASCSVQRLDLRVEVLVRS